MYNPPVKKLIDCKEWGIVGDPFMMFDEKESVAYNVRKLIEWAVNYQLYSMSFTIDLESRELNIHCDENSDIVLKWKFSPDDEYNTIIFDDLLRENLEGTVYDLLPECR